MDVVKKFFDFEMRNGLFDIVDQYGLRPWEAIRYEVMMRVLHGSSPSFVSINTRRPFNIRLKTILNKLYKSFLYILCHPNRENLFYLCSRDKKEGSLYDKVSDDLYNSVDKNSRFAIESTGSYLESNYKYGSEVSPDIPLIFAKYIQYKYDYSDILEHLRKEFPSCSIDVRVMDECYRLFVTEYKFYKLLFRWCRTKRVLMVQNGIRKGMFAAANELGVTVLELQHGQISMNHPAYSYPSEELLPATKIYHPNYLLTFGAFWTKNRCYPGVENVVLGNNSYGEVIKTPDVHGNKKLLVISNKTEGPLLADRVEEVLKKEPSFSFVFKLHPHQYNEFDEYQTKFVDDSRVEVVSNQQTINQLLSQCEGVFLNDSTVELEALHLGRKVFVLTEQDYMCMDFVFGEEGVYLCKDVDEFLEKYEKNKDVKLAPRDDLFVKFDENVARRVIQL